MPAAPVPRRGLFIISVVASAGCLDTKPPGPMLGATEFVSGSNDEIAHPFAEGMIHAAGETLGSFLENVDTSGSLESAERMVSGAAPLGLVQEDVLRYAQREFERQYMADPDTANRDYLAIAAQLELVMAAYRKYLFLLINTDRVQDIYDSGEGKPGSDGKLTLEDLLASGTPITVNLGAVDSDTYITAKTVVDAHHFESVPDAKTYDAATGIRMVVDGLVDAAFLVDVHPASALSSIAADAPVGLVRVSMPSGQKHYLEDGTIYRDAYPFQSEHIDDTLVVYTVLAAGPTFSDRVVDVFIDYVLDHAEEYAAFEPRWRDVSEALSKPVILKDPRLSNHRALLHTAGVEALDPLFVEPYFCSGDGLGAYHDMAVELIYLLSRNLDVDLKEKNTTGSWENSYWLHKGAATMALVQEDTFDYLDSYGDPTSSLQAAAMKKVAPLHYEYVHLVANTNAFARWGLGPNGFAYGSATTLAVRTVDGAGGVSGGRSLTVVPYVPSPEAIGNLRATVRDSAVNLSWLVPTASAYHHVQVWVWPIGSLPPPAPRLDNVTAPGAEIAGLANGTAYFILVRSVDSSGASIADVVLTAAPAAEAASEVSELTVEVQGQTAVLSWVDPVDATYVDTGIWYGDYPAANTRFSGPMTGGEGTRVFPNSYLWHIEQILHDPGVDPPAVLRLNVGPKTSGTFISATRLLDAYRVVDSDGDGTADLDEIEIHYSFDNPSDAVDEVAAGIYDAAFVVSGVPQRKLYGHDTYSLPENVRILATQFYDRNSDGDHADDTPEPYREGVLAGGGTAIYENYPYAREVLPWDIPAVRLRALLVASPAFDDNAVEVYIRSILRKAYYQVNPSDPDDPDFAPNPLWLPISIESFAPGEAPYATYGEDVVGAKERFVRDPFGWSPHSAEYYLSLFPEN